VQKFDRNALAAGEGMVRRQHRNNSLAQQFANFEPFGLDRSAEECHVKCARQ
jgi:hypothetical protein